MASLDFVERGSGVIKQKVIKQRYRDPERLALFQNQPPILQSIFATRSLSSPEELDLSLQQLPSFHSLLNIEKAIALLESALLSQKKVMVIGDFDADGATSTALVVCALKHMGFEQVDFMVPNRFLYGYGLTPELVRVASEKKPDLLLTVDNGIASVSGVETAHQLGIQVIITDHHLPPEILPDADAIINPNQVGDEFPCKNLAGVGVAFYVMSALRRRLIETHYFEKYQKAIPNMADFLDLVALGTVADLVKLDRVNRILVSQGIKRIQQQRCRLGILSLLEVGGRDPRFIQASDLGFAVAARLNAAGRLDDMSLGIRLLLAETKHEAKTIAIQLDHLNRERKAIEKNMQFQAQDNLKQYLEQTEHQQTVPNGMSLYDPSFHQGVIGILANRIKDQFHKPVFVFARGLEGEIKGSGRSIEGFHLRDALAEVASRHPNLILKFGGHAGAAGLSLLEKDFPLFSKAFAEVCERQLDPTLLENILWSDGALAAENINMESADLLQMAGPWGQQFPEPLFDDTFELMDQRLMAEKHLRLKIKKSGYIFQAVAFFVDTSVWPNFTCKQVKLAYRLQTQYYQGVKQLQLLVEQLEAC